MTKTTGKRVALATVMVAVAGGVLLCGPRDVKPATRTPAARSVQKTHLVRTGRLGKPASEGCAQVVSATQDSGVMTTGLTERERMKARILGELKRGTQCDWQSILRWLDENPSLLNEEFGLGKGVLRTLLSVAAANGPLSAVEALLKRGADVTSKTAGRSALSVAVEEREHEVAAVVRLLLAYGASAQSDKDNLFWRLTVPYKKAFNADREEAAGLLLAAGGDVNASNTPLLFYACYRDDDKSYLDWLLANGAAVDGRAPDGSTALLAACTHGAVELAETNVRRLLAAGADPNVTDQNGKTPLLALLARSGVSSDDPAIQLLLAYGANASATTLNTYTLLHALAEAGNCERLETYLDYPGTSPNEVTTEGLTPVMAAVRGGRADTLEILLRRGADLDPDAVYPDGRTVRYWAENSGNPRLIKLFQEAQNVR